MVGSTIDAFYLSRHCSVCGELTTSTRVVCEACAAPAQAPMAGRCRLTLGFKS